MMVSIGTPSSSGGRGWRATLMTILQCGRKWGSGENRLYSQYVRRQRHTSLNLSPVPRPPQRSIAIPCAILRNLPGPDPVVGRSETDFARSAQEATMNDAVHQLFN